jgi:small subunit ribosomal protein S17
MNEVEINETVEPAKTPSVVDFALGNGQPAPAFASANADSKSSRGQRKVRQGVVVSAAGDKTCVVEIKERKPHPIYGKMMTRTKKFHAHDENNIAGLGDVVTIMETRPISKLKRWRLLEITEKAK